MAKDPDPVILKVNDQDPGRDPLNYGLSALFLVIWIGNGFLFYFLLYAV